jgi:cyclopropane fatty-acyl-phospholipid synthase-like methyltransferase
MVYSRRSQFVSRGLSVAVALSLLFALAGVALRADDDAEGQRLFELLELKPGMTVAEIGAGSGSLTVAVAQRLGDEGRVFSTELNPDRRAEIRATATRRHLTNITIVEAGEQSTNLPEGCCDAIFMRDVYHHFTHPDEIDKTLVAALKPGGRVGIIDFEPSKGSQRPAGVPENRGGHGIPARVVIDELTAAGLTLSHDGTPWPEGQANRDHAMFLLLFRK